MEENNTAVVVAPQAGLSVVNPFNSGFNAEDFRVPFINCIQKMSDIDGKPGELVLDRKAVVVKNGKKVPVTVVAVQKSWAEKVPFDSDIERRVAYTPEQLAAIKADTQFQIIPQATFHLLVPLVPEACEVDDEDAADLFPFVLCGTPYQLAKIICQQVGYDNTYKILNSYHIGNPDAKLNAIQWNFSTMLVERGKYSWYVPVLGRTNTPTPEPVLAFINRLLAEGGAA